MNESAAKRRRLLEVGRPDMDNELACASVHLYASPWLYACGCGCRRVCVYGCVCGFSAASRPQRRSCGCCGHSNLLCGSMIMNFDKKGEQHKEELWKPLGWDG